MEYIAIDQLTSAEYNPRKIAPEALEKLKKKLVEDKVFFEKRPLLVNRRDGKLVVYAGNQRLLAARELGWTEVPVDIDEMSLEVEKARGLQDNKNFAEWEWETLREVYTDEQLLAAGFSEGELGITPEEEKQLLVADKNPLDHQMETYLNSDLRQIVLIFDTKTYEEVMNKMMQLMQSMSLETNTDVFLKLLEAYEHAQRPENSA